MWLKCGQLWGTCIRREVRPGGSKSPAAVPGDKAAACEGRRDTHEEQAGFPSPHGAAPRKGEVCPRTVPDTLNVILWTCLGSPLAWLVKDQH